jgi:FkbM family methyltransferase
VEKELEFLDILCDRNKISIDVGANGGEYLAAMMPLSRQVYAYEPIPLLANQLKRRFPKAVVRECALSNKVGSAVLYVPEYHDEKTNSTEALDGWASIVKDYSLETRSYPDKFPVVNEIRVRTQVFDDENVSPVGFMKIDVEGAEMEVLEGSVKTLAQLPVLLIEIEERHRKGATRTVPEFLRTHGYRGYFIYEIELRPIEEFSIETMQTGKIFPGKVPHYFNNFIFFPKNSEYFADSIRKRLSR